MSARTTILFLIVLVVAPLIHAKNKKKQALPDYVLQAQWVLVVIHPEAGEPLTNPTANRAAQDNVEQALTKWGRFKLVMDARNADLIIAVRKGHPSGPTVSNSPADRGPVIQVGGQQGRSPDLTNPGLGPPDDRGPRIGSEIGPSEDTFEVYMGRVEHPLDAPPIWRYMGKDALDGPQIRAVDQFRNAIIESEKQHQSKP